MSCLDPDLRDLSAADLLAMIQWIESGKSEYHGFFHDVEKRLKEELDYRVLCLVKNGDSLRE